MSSQRAAGSRKGKKAAAAVIEMSDADDLPQQTSAATAAAADSSAGPSSSSRPRRSAATHARFKLLQQAFESERPAVSSQTAAANGQQMAAAPATAVTVAAAAAAPEAPRRRGRPLKQKGARTASTAASAKRAVTGKRVRFTHSSSSESEAEGEESAEADQPGRKERGGSRGGRGRTSTVKPPPRKKARGDRHAQAEREEKEDPEEEEGEDRAARSARRAGGRRGRCASSSMQSDEEADDGSDEDGKSSSDSSESEQSEEEEEEEEDAEMEEERSEEEEEEEEESAESSDPEEEEEEDEADAWLPGAESARSMAAAKRSARRKAAKAKAEAKAESKAKPKSAASKPAAADAAASSSPKGPATTPSLMDLLDIDDEKAHVDVMRLALESDSDESLAALLCSRSSKDGSTFLQRFYRIHCAFHTPGFADHRPRLLRLIELHGAFHASARNDAGETLLHTICSPATYLRIHLPKRRSSPYLKTQASWTTSHNRALSFTDGLLEMLIRRGADFRQPDEKGAIPMLQLIKSARAGLVNVSIVEDVLFPPAKMKAKYKGGARLQAFDLGLTDRFDSTVLTLLCHKWKAQGKVWTIAHMLKRRASDLKDADLFANNTSGHCVLSLLALAASQLKQPPPQHSWEIRANEQREKLPQQLLQAWQTARSPALRKELDAWMIPVLAEICCEYLMGPTQKDGVEMWKQEQRRVFGRASSTTSAAAVPIVLSAKAISILTRKAAPPMLIRRRQSRAESATPTAAAEVEGEGEQLGGDGDGMDGAKAEVMSASNEKNAEPAEAAAPAAEEDDGPTDTEF